ncbi:hypothetical protein V491_02575, partial [Pseudogymnoascus sp. VKM F-3775]
ARKLLDRLENVFARELSAEGCTCIMCSSDPDGRLYHARALGWGDVLEWVSGRRSLPPYPAFDFGDTTTGLGKKKKKPASNPARGFATTSVASKVRIEVAETAPSDESPDNESE